MKKLNVRDCLMIFQKANYYFSNVIITVKEYWDMTKEADEALNEARKELFAIMQTG